MPSRLLFLVILLIVSFAVTSCAKDPQQRIAEHKGRASAHLKAGKWDDAILELRSALQSAPEDSEALLALADALLGKGQPREAFQVLTQLIELQPENLDAHLRLGNLFLLGNSPKEAEEKADLVLESAPDLADAWALKGLALIRQGQLAVGLAKLDEAIRHQPNKSEYRLSKAGTLYRAGNLPEARDTLENLLKVDRENGMAWVLLAQVAELQGDAAGVQSAFTHALESQPRDPGVWMNFGNFWMSKGQTSLARQAYWRAAEVAPSATAGLEKCAEIDFLTGDLSSAAQAVEAIESRSARSPIAIYFRARLHLAQGQHSQAEAGFRELLRQEPNHAPGHYFLGLSLYAQGSLQAARSELLTTLQLDSDLEKARLLLAQVSLDRLDLAEALKLSEELLRGAHPHPEALLIQGTALLGLNRIPEARRVLERLVAAAPGHAEAWKRLGVCHAAEKQWDKALTAFSKAMEAAPRDIAAVALSADVLTAQGHLPMALDLIEKHMLEMGDSAPARELLGRLYVRDGKPRLAREHLARAIEINPGAVEAYLLLAALREGPESSEEALADIERAVSREPNYPKSWMMKGALHDARGERDKANESYRKVLELTPDFIPALNNLAWNLAESGGDINEALKFAERAVELSPKSATLNDTLGWIYVKKGAFLKAVAHLETAAGPLGKDPRVQYHLARAYAGAGYEDKARKALERALAAAPPFAGEEDARALLQELDGRR
jgi:tetratricopeptide (TPR) repeat protein